MKKIIIISFLFFINTVYSQQSPNLSGAWHWNSINNENSFDLYLTKTSTNSYKGHHCAVFYNGKKIDCVEDTQAYSVQFTLIGNNTYQGTIKSGYCMSQGTIKLTYDPVAQTLLFEILTEPNGEFYLPDSVYLKRY